MSFMDFLKNIPGAMNNMNGQGEGAGLLANMNNQNPAGGGLLGGMDLSMLAGLIGEDNSELSTMLSYAKLLHNGLNKNPNKQAEKYVPFPRMDNAQNTDVTQNAEIPYPSNPTVEKIAEAIARLESGGKYDAMGPVTKKGDRAFGKYQIMGNNIPSWSKEALGRSVTPDEFLANPHLQDTIAHHKMGKYLDKYGNPQDVASAWFSGRPLKNNNSRDVLGTSVPKYVQIVMDNLRRNS